MHSAESILGQASLPQDGVCPFSGLWCTHFWATAEVFWQGASTLGTNGCLPTFFYSYNTHTHVYFRDTTQRKMETQHGPVALLPFPVAFTTSLLVPPSGLTLPGALSLLCPTPFCFPGGAPHLHLSEQLPLDQQNLPFFSYVNLLFCSSDMNPSCCTWLNTNSPNQHHDKTLPPKTLRAELLWSQKQGEELLWEQTRNERVTKNTRILP